MVPARTFAWPALAFALGAFLRLYLLPGQILLDDEWHGLNFVIGKSWWEILARPDPLDHSSAPLNLYVKLLYDAFVWSEAALRLPVLLAGLATLVVLPLRVVVTVGRRAALVFAFFLAISPFLIGYSRFFRGYACVALFGFLALWSGWAWLTNGSRREGITYVVTGSLAVWFHPAAIVAALMPLAFAFLPRVGEGGASLRNRLVLGATFAVLLSVIELPAFLERAKLPLGISSLDGGTLVDAAYLASGTYKGWLLLAWTGLFGWGFLALARRRRLLGALVAATGIAYVGFLGLAGPRGIDTAHVLLRYSIALFPMLLLCAAVGVDRALTALAAQSEKLGYRMRPWIDGLLIAGWVIALLAWGPLPSELRAPNDFTGHSAFQGSAEPVSWTVSDARHVYPGVVLTADEVSPFYRAVASEDEVDTLVEYPFDVTNYNSLLYFHQHVHRKRVIAGYALDPRLAGFTVESPGSDGGAGEVRVGRLTADQILSRVNDPSKLRLRNMVDVMDLDALRSSGADRIVLHKKMRVLRILDGSYDHVEIRLHSTRLLEAAFRALGGPPVYEDDQLVAFRIPSNGT